MKAKVYWVVLGILINTANAETVWFSTSTNHTTTGEAIEGVRDTAFTTNVQEIAGLYVTVRTGQASHQLNADSGSIGINNLSTNADQAARFESDEILFLSFSKDVEITYFDFRYFDEGESFVIASSNQADFIIEYDALNDKGSDFIHTNLTITANTEMEVYAATDGNLGLEAMNMDVLGGSGDLSLSIMPSNSLAYVIADFDGAATTNYVLQSCTNLTSNAWNTVSFFAEGTNWLIETTNAVEYFRVILEQ